MLRRFSSVFPFPLNLQSQHGDIIAYPMKIDMQCGEYGVGRREKRVDIQSDVRAFGIARD